MTKTLLMKSPISQSLIRKINKFPHVKKAYAYAVDVISEKIPACTLTKLACKRFIDDLKKSEEDSFIYEFDCSKGERICAFAEMLPHVKGKWARHSMLERLIILEPWQCFMFVNLTGWVHKKTKLRRYREAYIEVPRKNGKSLIAAVIGLYFFLVDKEPGAEVYCGATTEKQAFEVFRPARRMCEVRPELTKHFDITIYQQALKLPDESLFQPIIGKPGDGSSPHLAILDEYHEHPDSTAYDAMQTGMGAREQPLLLIITTAGFNSESPCHDKHDDCVKVLSSAVKDEEQFVLIYSIDSTDDPFCLDSLIKANPNFGVSVMPDYLERQCETAKRSPAAQNKYLVKHLNVWTTSDEAFFNMVEWQNLSDPALRIEQFKGVKSVFAIDLASKLDICAFVILFIKIIDGKKHYFVFAKHYLPEETIDDTENVNFQLYQKFIRTTGSDSSAVLTAVPGAETDFNAIKQDIVSNAHLYTPTEVAFDIWNAQSLMQDCAREGLPVVEVPQIARTLSAGMKEIESAIKAKRIHHDGNPVLSWCMSNVIAQEDRNGNFRPIKKRKSTKIDSAVALIMAVSRALLVKNMSISEAVGMGYGVRLL